MLSMLSYIYVHHIRIVSVCLYVCMCVFFHAFLGEMLKVIARKEFALKLVN